MVSKAVGGSVNHCGGEQRKYDGVDFTIVRSVRRRWHIYITKNKKHRRPARRILIYSTNAET